MGPDKGHVTNGLQFVKGALLGGGMCGGIKEDGP